MTGLPFFMLDVWVAIALLSATRCRSFAGFSPAWLFVSVQSRNGRLA